MQLPKDLSDLIRERRYLNRKVIVTSADTLYKIYILLVLSKR
jgi:hypothetical protein